MGHDYWMRQALALAEQAGAKDEVPVGALLVDNRSETLLGQGFNQPISGCDPSAHAEIVALRKAAHVRQNYRLPDTTLYVTLEPCSMCAGAIIHARVARVVIAAREPRAGAAGSVLNVLDHPKLNHRCELVFGVLGEESAQLLRQFFALRRK